MSTKNILFLLIMSICLVLINIHGLASDLQIGGEMNASLIGLFDTELGIGAIPQASVDVELFFPPWDNNELKCEGLFYTDIEAGEIDFFLKKLYWKHKYDNLQLSIGRQPISWSFGSLLNPVDFTLGSVALEEESNSKFQNAVEAYFPINWNTSLSLVAALPEMNSKPKLGIRARTLVEGFDLTFNLVHEPVDEGGDTLPQQRIGITAKGDVGAFGVYGALGYYKQKSNDFSVLGGIDYSYFFDAGNQLYFQWEYLSIPQQYLDQITGSVLPEMQKGETENVGLLIRNTTYHIDEFSNISLTSFSNLAEGSRVIMPSYSNQVNTNATINISAGMKIEEIQNQLIPSFESIFNNPPQVFLEIGISYAF